jgi:predicted TIM-barrel fold metal-dependent hydrolase
MSRYREFAATFIFCTALVLFLSGLANADVDLSTIPRIDAHAHVGDVDRMKDYVEVGKVLKDKYKVNLEIWINLSFQRRSGGDVSEHLQAVRETYKDRFLPCINDYRIQDGLRYSPDELSGWMDKGIVGYKLWFGVTDMIDDPMFEPTFAKMEEIGMVGASIHVAQPCPTKWCEDPVRFWQAQNAWERVLDRHPKLVVVNAHMLDHFNSDEQLDYLAYVLETYPNLHVDLAARFQQFHRIDRDKLRAFIIKYDDRILYGTDIGGQPKAGQYEQVAERYHRTFQLLETDRIIQGGFFGETQTKGLALPEDVLKKIYYQNAVRLYPRAKDVLIQLGYAID